MPVIPSNQPQQPTIQPEQQPLGKREAGSGFTNISQILGANINKPTGLSAGTQMGQQIGSSIGNQAGQVRAGVEQSAQAFKSNYDLARNQALGAISGASQYIDPNAVAAATSTTTATTGTTPSTETTGAAAPSPIVKAATPVTAQTTTTTTPYATTVLPSGLSGLSAADAQAIGKNLSGAAYTGPTGLANQAVLAGQAQSLKDIGKYAMSGSLGQQELLRSMVATPGTYTRGQSQLDRALLAQSQAGQKAIQSGAQQALQTQQGVINQQNIASNLASQAASNIPSQVAQTKAGLISTLGGVQQAGIMSASNYDANANRIKDILSGNVSSTDLTDSDKALLANTQQYGIDTSIRVDPRNLNQADFLKQLVGGYKQSQVGDIYFSPEMQQTGVSENALKNLALLSGQTVPKLTPFDINRFGTNLQQEQGLVAYKNMQEAQRNIVGDISSKISSAKNLQDLSQQLIAAINEERDRTASGFSNKKIQELYNKITGGDLKKDYGYQSSGDLGEKHTVLSPSEFMDISHKALNAYLTNSGISQQQQKELELEQNLQKGISLQDYINSKFNLQNQSIPTTISGSGATGLNTIIRPIG